MLRYLEDEDQGKRRRRPGRGEDRRRGGVRLGPGWGRVGCVGVGGASARCTQVCSVDGVWGRGWSLGGAKLRGARFCGCGLLGHGAFPPLCHFHRGPGSHTS